MISYIKTKNGHSESDNIFIFEYSLGNDNVEYKFDVDIHNYGHEIIGIKAKSDKEIYDEFVEEFKSYKTYFVNKEEKALLEEYCFGVKANSKNCAEGKLNADIVGKPAAWIAEQAGF